jgi:hypothetical protein
MTDIPTTINGVAVDFGASVNEDVHDRIVEGLKACIKTSIAPGRVLSKIHISSANDQHAMPSRHAQEKAVDISRINGVKMVIGYPQGGDVTAIVQAIQTAFESYAHRRENFGPFFKKKLGAPHMVGGHGDHIHLSVN